MITMSDFGRPGGPRLGNQLFQYASLIGIAQRSYQELALPAWKYAKAFEGSFPGNPVALDYKKMTEPDFHYSLFVSMADSHVDVTKSYLQSEQYFKPWEHLVREALKFKKQFVIDCLRQFPHAFEKKTIALHVRRGDYVNNKNYLSLSIPYYLCTLEDHFPDWRNMNLIFFSDDMKWVKTHFGCLENAFFSEHNSDIEDLCLMSQCDNFILSNSTFAWWSAWLADRGKVVRPTEYFSGNLKLRCDTKDFWPERWTQSHVDKKIDLQDTTFMIPVTYDHEDRKKNFDLTTGFIHKNFNTYVMVREHMTNKFSYCACLCNYDRTENVDGTFHRTRILNLMARRSSTPIIVNWDADIIMSPVQIFEAVHKIRAGADMVYPYDGRFAKVPRSPWFDRTARSLDIAELSGIAFSGLEKDRRASVGGAVFFNKTSFFEGGGENENYISYGPEDRERFYRFTALGYRVDRVNGVLYHMNHFKGKDSRPLHENHARNLEEHRKIKSMDADQLREYVNSWPWLK